MNRRAVMGLACVLAAATTERAQADDEATRAAEQGAERTDEATKTEAKGERDANGQKGERDAKEKPTRLSQAKGERDEPPPPPKPEVPQVGIVKDAGVGSDVAYGRARVLELGGAATFTGATDFTQITFAPSIGWFVVDNVELSGILGISHISASGNDSNFVTALVEPSFHLPFQDTIFGFVGLGAGVSWIENSGTGFALAPRIGLNLLVGRSGVFTPQFLIQYSTHETVATNQGSLVAVNVTYSGGLGYTVMW